MKKLLALLLLIAACDKEDPAGTVCTAIYAFGLTVEVKDSVTGEPLSDGVVVTDEDGVFHETLQSVVTGSWAGAGERAGNYTVHVTKEGYLPWTQTGILVTKDECHVHGVHVTARMVKPTP